VTAEEIKKKQKSQQTKWQNMNEKKKK
jgi:hypothetical protein